MNKFLSFLITLAIVTLLVSPFYLFAYSMGEAREEKTLLCESLCINKDMEFFDYDTKIRGDVFCECLEDGIMKKFALGRKHDG